MLRKKSVQQHMNGWGISNNRVCILNDKFIEDKRGSVFVNGFMIMHNQCPGFIIDKT